MTIPTLDEQIVAVRREIALRERAYPTRIEIGRLKQEEADHEIACMKAILGTLMAARALSPLANVAITRNTDGSPRG